MNVTNCIAQIAKPAVKVLKPLLCTKERKIKERLIAPTKGEAANAVQQHWAASANFSQRNCCKWSNHDSGTHVGPLHDSKTPVVTSYVFRVSKPLSTLYTTSTASYYATPFTASMRTHSTNLAPSLLQARELGRKKKYLKKRSARRTAFLSVPL